MNKYWKLAALLGAGAATVATGGAAAPALAAAGSAGAGAAGAGAAGAGLLGGAAGAGAAGAGAAGGAGLLGGATTAAIPMGSAVGTPLASAAAGGGLAPTGFAGYMAQAKPFMEAAGTGIQAANALMPQQQPTQAPQLPQQNGAQTLQQLAQQPQVDVMAEAEMRRKRRQGLLGGMA